MKTKGFTLIELLVVVAIIGILATVVLASLGSARTRASDAAIKSALSSMRAQAEIQYLEAGNTYNTVCDLTSPSGKLFVDAHSRSKITSSVNNFCGDQNGDVTAIPGATLPTTTGLGYSGTPTPWMAEIQLNGGGWFCVDANGTAKETSSISRGGTPFDKRCR